MGTSEAWVSKNRGHRNIYFLSWRRSTRLSQQKEGYDLETYHQKQLRFGTIAVVTNTTQSEQAIASTAQSAKQVALTTPDKPAIPTAMSPQKVFEYLKSRNDIEQLNDTYKNILEADRTYMQTDATMEAWHFINFLALRAYYRLFATLSANNLTKQLSPADALLLLQCKKKVKINAEWIDAEVPKKAQDLLNKIFIPKDQSSKPVP